VIKFRAYLYQELIILAYDGYTDHLLSRLPGGVSARSLATVYVTLSSASSLLSIQVTTPR
jgi:hypothetical protein